MPNRMWRVWGTTALSPMSGSPWYKVIQRDFNDIRKWLQSKKTYPKVSIIIERGLVHWMKTGTHIKIWELQDSKYREELEIAIQAQNHIGWQNMLKGRIASEWGDIQMKHYKDVYEDDMPKHISATWWASEFIQQLLYFSLAIWQHRNTYLHNTMEKANKLQERMTAVEEMAKWYERKNKFPVEVSLNFLRSFIEQCTYTTAQIRLWLGTMKRHSYRNESMISSLL